MNKRRIGLILLIFLSSVALRQLMAQIWTQKANFPGVARYAAFEFVIGNKGYMGTGRDGNIEKQDFWEYDPALDTWTQKSNFPGIPRYQAIGFTVNGKGYAGLGSDGSTNIGDMYEYDATSNTWLQVAGLNPGRSESSVFVIGNLAYVVGGVVVDNLTPVNEVWAFDPALNSWTQKNNFPGGERARGNGFAIGGKGYFGLGHDNTVSNHSDFWEYDPATDTWIQKASFPDARRTAGEFVIGSSGYIGVGYSSTWVNTFYEYNSLTDTWIQRANFPPIPERYSVSAFAIGNKGYMGLGRDENLIMYAEWYEFTPVSTSISESDEIIAGFNVFPVPATNELYVELRENSSNKLDIYTCEGRIVMSQYLTGETSKVDIGFLSPGIYYLRIAETNVIKKIIKI